MKDIDIYVAALENYRDGQLLGSELLHIWEKSPHDIHYIYYNLFHLVDDEDIRQKDEYYKEFQLKQLDELISELKVGKLADELKHLNFL